MIETMTDWSVPVDCARLDLLLAGKAWRRRYERSRAAYRRACAIERSNPCEDTARAASQAWQARLAVVASVGREVDRRARRLTRTSAAAWVAMSDDGRKSLRGLVRRWLRAVQRLREHVLNDRRSAPRASTLAHRETLRLDVAATWSAVRGIAIPEPLDAMNAAARTLAEDA